MFPSLKGRWIYLSVNKYIMNRSFSKIRHIQESNQRLEKRLLSEQTPTGTTTNNIDKDKVINDLGLKSINDAFIKYGFTRNDNPQKTRSPYQLVVAYDKKPFYEGNITEDGKSGVRILVKTTLKDITLQKCNAKTHDLDNNYIPLNVKNVDCILGRLTNQITD
jgi:hypothetical protein